MAIEKVREVWESAVKYPKRHLIRVIFDGPLLPEGLKKGWLVMDPRDAYDAICEADRKAFRELKDK